MDKNFLQVTKQWYAIDANDVINFLKSDQENGLLDKEAEERSKETGRNILPVKKKVSPVIRFLKQFNSILIYVLFAAAVVTALLGEYIDTLFIMLVVLINAIIGFIQENKAGKAIDKIKNMMSLKAKVIRNGKRSDIEASGLTIGDIVLLDAGDKVPADLRLLRAEHLRTDESSLTGESLPSEKNIHTLDADTLLGDRANMAFAGTSVNTGIGAGIVIAIGVDTEIGKISQMINEVKAGVTPLMGQMAKLEKTVSAGIVIIAVLVFIFGYFFRSYETGILLLSVIGLAVAAIPEGMPAILSIILAIGVRNMAKRKAIIRHLASVETLGAVSVIFTDKTGTLTQNEMTVKTVQTRDNAFDITGTGYTPSGAVLINGEKTDAAQDSILTKLLHCIYVCNDAAISQNKNNHWEVTGDPTDGALITLYRKAGLELYKPHRLYTIPFDSHYKFMATLIEAAGIHILFVKGAPESLLGVVDKEQSHKGIQQLDREYWSNKMADLSGEGLRVIGCAYKIVGDDVHTITRENLESDLIFLGLTGMMDPPREEAVEAIKACREAGISVKMITGDYIDTARVIARDMCIGDGIHALQGKDIEKESNEQLLTDVVTYDVFARTTPEHKLRLVSAMQANGAMCAMTGDGVNDAPALRKADVGIAMGIKGTDVAKDAAEMILADDNFSTIVSAVEEGRRVYANIKKVVLFILPTNGAESLLIIASIILGIAIPLTPLQILWVNMITSVTISFALAFEKIEPGTMKQPPHPPKERLLNGYFLWRIVFISILIGGGSLIINILLIGQGYNAALIKTIILQTIVMAQLFHMFNCRSITGFAFNKNFFSNKAIIIVTVILIVLQCSITYLPFMNTVFGTYPLGLSDWIYPVGLGVIVFCIVEIEKMIMRLIHKYKVIIK